MKIFTKFLILLITLALMGPFFIKDQEGRPLLTLQDIQFSGFPALEEIITKNKPILQSATSGKADHSDSFKAYKWKDEKGVVHYSDQHNSRDNSQLTEIENITILPTLQTNSTPQPKHRDSTHKTALPSLTTIPAHQIPTLIEDAKQVENLLIERKNHYDQLLE